MNPGLVGLLALIVGLVFFGYGVGMYLVADALRDKHNGDDRWFLGTIAVGLVLLVGIGAVVVAATS